ncbi:amidohydrolase family protein [Gluconacetobacter azotocaptans]|uniref:Amidohydrolase family protein n=2 Tax=Gluconacetobacter azotocaptans TaxID=142834 RepID=A0A7W4JRM9_9PROT|nr:amidohydrolase family protein [Gluconacetobacter azotocaptans]GBQ26527.1 amidohydrolase [Gluconacetobacter azotocaptans DSM 13594]
MKAGDRIAWAMSLAVCGGLYSGAAMAAAPVLLDHTTLIDGTGAAAQSDSAILIQDGRIAAVGHSGAVAVPGGTKTVDLSGMTVLPGLISDHSHTGLVKGTKVDASNYTRANILAALKQYERYGVLTVTSLGLNNSPLFDQLRQEQHAGSNPGADLFGVDQGIGAPDGVPPQGMFHLGPDQIYRPTTEAEARAAVDRMVDEGTDLVKVWVDTFRNGVPGAKGFPKMDPAIYRAVIAEAHARGKRVAAHIHDLSDAKALVEAGADIIAHGVRDQPVDTDFIMLMEQKGAWYIATLDLDEANYIFALHPEWLDDPVLSTGLSPELRAQFADPAWRAKVLAAPLTAASKAALAINEHNLLTLYRAGIRIGFGTDSGASPTRIPGFAEHRELKLMVEAGLTPMQALAVATGNAAALMHLSDRGVILPGRLADLFVVSGDPATDITAVDRIEQVWHRGVKTDGPLVAR